MNDHCVLNYSQLCGGKVIGDEKLLVEGFCSVENPCQNHLSFIEKQSHLNFIQSESFYIVKPEWESYVKNGITHPNPRNAFQAILSAVYASKLTPSVSDTAIIAPNAKVSKTSEISAGCHIGANTKVGESCFIGKNTVIEDNVTIEDGCYIDHNVTIRKNTVIGKKCRISSGAVIGDRGFGFVLENGKWLPVPQIGKVTIGNEVFIGANSCIDCGAIDDTIIGNHVIIDNLVHIAHNVHIGEGSAMASGVGIAGSTKVGKYCMLAGQVGVVGHIHIADNVHVNGGGKILRSIKESGLYSGSFHVLPSKFWNRLSVYFSRLDKLFKERS